MENILSDGILNRRSFIKNSALTTASLLTVSLFTGGCEDFFRTIANRPVRRQIRDNAEALRMIDIYREAVGKMKDSAIVPVGDNRSWNNQALIHQNHCPHNNWFFYSWHRAYLFCFENICRELTNQPTFALPYWNWCVDKKIHSSFWGSNNALYNSTRIATASSQVGSSANLTTIDGFMDENDFLVFGGEESAMLRPNPGSNGPGNIESGVHNYIHGTFVRGDMSTYMSPLDPIFWNHHCMVDLCWNEWNITRNHANTADTRWADFNFSGMFFDKSGNNTEISTLSTILMPILSYRYETGINGIVINDLKAVLAKNKADFERTKKILQAGATVKFDVKKRFEVENKMDFNTLKSANGNFITNANDFQRVFSNNNEERALLILKGINEPQSPDLFLRVFLNKNDANPETSTKDPHYAGSFYFFTHGKHDDNSENPKLDLKVDITDTLRILQKLGELKDLKNLNVTVVAVPIDGRDASKTSVSLESMEIAISPIVINQMPLK